MTVNRTVIVLTASATLVAGAVFFAVRAQKADDSSPMLSADRPHPQENKRRFIPEAKMDKPGDRPRKRDSRIGDRPQTKATEKEFLPDSILRLLVDRAVDSNDYKALSALLGKLDRISNSEIRLRLLEGLAWFDETSVADSLPFLADSDERVASAAAEIVTSRITSIPRKSQREEVYKVALKTLPEDSPDREILLATLETDSKGIVYRILSEFENEKLTNPHLWNRLKEVYETSFDRPYVNRYEALLHYNAIED